MREITPAPVSTGAGFSSSVHFMLNFTLPNYPHHLPLQIIWKGVSSSWIGLLLWGLLFLRLFAFAQGGPEKSSPLESFVSDGELGLLQQYVKNGILLGPNKDKALLFLSPQHQGRILMAHLPAMTSFNPAWIGHQLLQSGEVRSKYNPVGGVDRIWFGPEGGRFALFFKEGTVPGTPGAWRVPAPLDREPFHLLERTPNSVRLTKKMTLVNRLGTGFHLHLERAIHLLERQHIAEILSIPEASLPPCVAYESRNTVTNLDAFAWEPSKGLISIWVIGQFAASPTAVAMVPLTPEGQGLREAAINTINPQGLSQERLRVTGGTVFFRTDGSFKAKIGFTPAHAEGYLGAYDSARNLLTLIQYSSGTGQESYVNTTWDIEAEPYQGDIVNIYNSGKDQWGGEASGFYELESSSPALALASGESRLHVHQTFHFIGSPSVLAPLMQRFLGTDPATVANFLNP